MADADFEGAGALAQGQGSVMAGGASNRADKSPTERQRVPFVTERHRMAHSALVAAAVHLSTQAAWHANLQTWRNVLADLLEDCTNCPDDLIGLREMARALVEASGTRGQFRALSDLRAAVSGYYGFSAGDRVDAWRRAGGSR
ncbi:hypothetical protein [Roseicyclus sp.]|uniref:hypothetical protein n=1 Tax=Roseicyclus sp. TaxID=1914329 RepID=UPI003F6AEDC7